ncbi:MAG: DUF2791 family P-loop domain-containing protein [Albidovulum sp.]|nr:DUF2791 family P-loop domain-containing protein [Albidovulum sp.]
MEEKLAARLAVEALRNGVPNREAVRALGCNQPKAETRFIGMLDEAAGDDSPSASHRGMLVSGDFGTGKSHLLAHLEHLALSRNFVCSRVAISKETPLYDLGKVFTSAMENGRIPGRRGRFIEELALSMQPDSDEYSAFSRWADTAASNGLLNMIFPASRVVHERSGDLDLISEIESFWAGDRIQITKIRNGLKQIDQLQFYKFRAPKAAELSPQRLRFAVELIKSVGYRGWVVLLDEVELIGSYSILQRGRSYAEIARWMGFAHGENYPGLIVVGAVTEDFASAIISADGQRKDCDYVRPRLEQSMRYISLGARAERGMRILERNCLALQPPSDEDVKSTVATLRGLYEKAYDWVPPPYEATAGGAGVQGRMRYKVRAAINEWDLRRLHPGYQPITEFENIATSYEENADLERGTEDDTA